MNEGGGKLVSIEKINLNSSNAKWKIIQPDRKIEIEGLVPGSVFDDLITHKIIEDPFYGLNEHKVAWVYESEWLYELQFNLNDLKTNNGRSGILITDHSQIILRFYGIDTLAEVLWDGIKLGAVENMHRTYEFDITDMLRGDKKNQLHTVQVKIASPTKAAQREIDKYGVKLNTGPCGIAGAPYLRKAQYSFGWDWGPKLPDIGIWKDVEIIGIDGIKIDSVYPVPKLNYEKDPKQLKNIGNIKVVGATIDIQVDLQISDSILNNIENYDIKIKFDLVSPQGKHIIYEDKVAKNHLTRVINVQEPELWWSSGLGSPSLYELKTSVIFGNSDEVVDSITQKVGIREICLIRDPDQWGESFYFRLNGVPIFAKGADWIPVDSFIPRGKRNGLYEMNLKSALEANMNFIRVWGGGIYEDDWFYDQCDQLGILIWQDFPFACAAYPIHQEFYENFRQEAIENIKRIRHHACLAIWVGNNEVEQLWLPYTRNFLTKAGEYKEGYIHLFEELIPSLIKEYDPIRPYWPSSPSNGSIKDGGILKSNDPNRGDSHYWMVWHGGRPFKAYRGFNSRFMSEFGFESFPSIKTLSTICPEDQYDFYSPIMKNHQKNPAGNKKIMSYMKKRFSIPKDFFRQVIVSQITQAEAMEYGVEHWRRNRNDFHCMGSLYWQLNDCWQVASWSSLDYYGRWKALQYYAKRFYQGVFASVVESKEKAELWVVNDTLEPFKGVLQWKIFHSNGKELISGSEECEVDVCSANKIKTIDVKQINKIKLNRRNHVIFYNLSDKKMNHIISRGMRLFENPKDFCLKDPKLSFNIIKVEENQIEIDVKAEKIALYVYIDSDELEFIASDNFFSLMPNEAIQIILKEYIPWNALNNQLSNEKKGFLRYNKGELQSKIKIMSLYELIK